MQFLYFLLIIGAFKTIDANNCSNNKVVFCYWGSWSIYRIGEGTHTIRNIIPEYCTHVVYSFAGINLSGELDSLNPQEDIIKEGYTTFTNLKKKYPCVKFLLAVGGWNEGSEKFSLMVENKANREKFIERVIQFMIYFGFDGLDLDWEYPAYADRGGLPVDKENLVTLLEGLKERLEPRKRILTAAVSSSMKIIKAGYQVKELCATLDFVSIMGYDLNDPGKASVHSPLYSESDEDANRDTIDAAIKHYTSNNCPRNKIILGIPAYGRTYSLENKSETLPGSRVSGPGKSGPFTKEKGFLGYNEICKMLKEHKGWKTQLLSNNSVKYAWKDNQWVSFDDAETVNKKASYVLDEKLAGIMVWSIDTDDFHGVCFNESYPLLKAINKGLGNHVI